MRKIIALLILILFLVTFTYYREPNFLSEYNLSNLARNSALLSIYAIGVGFVIIAGGIDLSLGSVVALTGYLTAYLLSGLGWPPAAIIPIILLIGIAIGLLHGLLVANCRLQPFVVTLCGLLAYRGLARVLSGDQSGSLGSDQAFIRFLTKGTFLKMPAFYWSELDKKLVFGMIKVPMPVWICLAIAIAAALFLTRTIWGRYIFAVGNNEEASLYSGVNVKLTKTITYVICSTLGALSGLLEASDVGTVMPSGTGTFYELYAIAACVLGGCSLRGGEGNILGILLGAIAIRLIRNVTNMLAIPSEMEYTVLGLVILAGALVDAALERYRSRAVQGKNV
ncbi:MAG: ABC transporter permease [Planctomycetes bacterium]|nr:ABC transporter permease [Planctomycetota bacterium]